MEEELKKHQPSLTIEEQISNLKKLGLLIQNEENAKQVLSNISYYRLIKAYSLNLKTKNGKYYNNVTFEHIVELYSFNSDFRQIIFSQIEKIEVKARCLISNYFCEKYGVFGYIEKDNFVNGEHHLQFIYDITEELRRNAKAPFVRNFQNNYESGNLPFYALVEICSFGTLSKFYKNMKSEDKKVVAKKFGVGYTYLESWLEVISYVRNICAHYGRLYNAKMTKRPAVYKEYSEEGISNDRIFAILLCMRHLLLFDLHWNLFVDEIELLLEKYEGVDIKTMGFPENWKELLYI